jgi:FAD/FMN-containing dehydrogenase
LNFALTAEAGLVLKAAQDAAEAAGLMLPLSLASEGSCQIGGNLASNAGGTAVLRYGNARDLVLGLEVVLPDGRVWDGLGALRKDNAGYDLKQLFLGAEGTLGVITAAVLKLFPRPHATETAMVALADPEAATRLLARLRQSSGDAVSSFEYLHRAGLELVLAHIPGAADPFAEPHRHYALVELASGDGDGTLRPALEAALGQESEAGGVIDAVIADSLDQARRLWALRESVSEAQQHAGPSIKHDVSVPVSRVPEFLERAGRAMADAMPEATVVAFGHLGDGNIHFNLSPRAETDPARFLARTEAVNRVVHDIAAAMGGSFSAEHGIGVLKRGELARYKSAVELDLMRRLKSALDPDGIMNPGKLL